MKRMRLLGWTFGMMIFSMASLALPLPASAGGVHVSIGLGVPVYPAPVVVAPPPAVVYPAPVVVAPPDTITITGAVGESGAGARIPAAESRAAGASTPAALTRLAVPILSMPPWRTTWVDSNHS